MCSVLEAVQGLYERERISAFSDTFGSGKHQRMRQAAGSESGFQAAGDVAVPEKLNWFRYPFLISAIALLVLQMSVFYSTIRRRSTESLKRD